MKRILHILIISLLSFPLIAQNNTLSGIIYDKETGETLVGATVFIDSEVQIGAISDINGFFSLPNINQKKINANFSFIGYQKQVIKLEFKESNKMFIEIRLKSSPVDLNEVTITELTSRVFVDSEIEISHHNLTPSVIQSIPTARNDVFKALRFLPGVEATEPLSPLVSIRGSDPGENLITLDGVTVYNPYHFLASSGMFNMHTVKNVDILVGGFGAEYGGRNSSVINLSTKDGTKDGFHGEIEPSTYESKLFFEFPVSPKTTMMVAGRLNYDIVGNFIMQSNNYFYDTNLSLTHRFNPKNRLDIKYFGSKDHTSVNFNTFYKYMANSMEPYVDSVISQVFSDLNFTWENQWKNNIATAIWKSVISPKIYFRLQAYASLHSADNLTALKMDFDDVFLNTSTKFLSKVHDYSGKASISYTPFYGNEVKLGIEYNQYNFANNYKINLVEGQKAESNPDLISGFIEDKIIIGKLILRPGVRFSSFNDREIKTEPRFSFAYKFGSNWKIKAAFGHYYQYINSMNTQELELNQFLDYYYPLTDSEPSFSKHYIAGFEKKIGQNQQLMIDFYYKDIARTYTFDLLQSRLEAFIFSNKIFEGNGETYGMEILWKGYIINSQVGQVILYPDLPDPTQIL